MAHNNSYSHNYIIACVVVCIINDEAVFKCTVFRKVFFFKVQIILRNFDESLLIVFHYFTKLMIINTVKQDY